jgi:ABC-type glutathione transport system ATPase component
MQPLSARDRSAQILALGWRFEAPSWADRYAAAVRVVSLASIIGEIEAREGVNAVRLVGVDGPSGSGRSTLARRLSDRLAAPVVEIRRFLVAG